jgi:hypothetical protein
MTATEIITVGTLCLAALGIIQLIIVGIDTYHRGSRTLGLTSIAMAFGLVIAAAARAYITVASGSALATQNEPALRTKVTVLERSLTASERDRIALKIQADTALNGRAAVDKLMTERMARVASVVSEVQARVRDQALGLQLSQVADKPLPIGATNVDRMLGELEAFKSLSARSARPTAAMPTPEPAVLQVAPKPEPAVVPQPQPQPAANTSTSEIVRDLLRLKDRLGSEPETPNYDIATIDSRELIRGRKGRYYTINLKTASSGNRFFFDLGKFTFTSSLPAFRTALSAFATEVTAKLDGHVPNELLVRGRADDSAWTGQVDPAARYQQVAFLRDLGSGTYLGTPTIRRFDGPLSNVDLPYLRAAYLNETVTAQFPSKPPLVLDSLITSNGDRTDRGVDLILYVDW